MILDVISFVLVFAAAGLSFAGARGLAGEAAAVFAQRRGLVDVQVSGLRKWTAAACLAAGIAAALIAWAIP